MTPGEYLEEIVRECEKLPDNFMQVLYSNIDKAIITALKKSHECTEAVKVAGHLVADNERLYREKKKEYTKFYIDMGKKIGEMTALVQGDTAKYKAEVMKAETDLFYLKAMEKQYVQRSDALKHFSNKIKEQINRRQ
jgi:hypothetical protein